MPQSETSTDLDPTEIITNEATGTEYTVAEIENSSRIVKSVTPYYTADWYIKWIASIIVLFAVAIRSSGVPELQIWDIFLSWVGAAMWALVGFMWKDRAILLLNGVLGLMLFSGLIAEFFK
ncbi:MAG: hypothetical protein GY886_10545 [Gammaproteobacteria bacterium]|nr:hypothetical protein [Gammaproteobacteria bacterium]